MKAKWKEILPLSGGEWQITFTTREDPRKLWKTLKDAFLNLDIKKVTRKRSLDANSFCWALCTDIGKAMVPPVDKEDIYRRAIRAVGTFTDVDVILWDVQKVVERWTERGTGWFVDVADDAGIGRKKLFLYYGSSVYTTHEMHVLIDWLVDQAEQMQIPIPASKIDQQKMLELWGGKKRESA